MLTFGARETLRPAPTRWVGAEKRGDPRGRSLRYGTPKQGVGRPGASTFDALSQIADHQGGVPACRPPDQEPRRPSKASPLPYVR